MKTYKKILLILIIILLAYPVFSIFKIYFTKLSVNKKISLLLLDLEKDSLNSKRNIINTYYSKTTPEKEILWNNKLVRIKMFTSVEKINNINYGTNSYVIEAKEQNSSEWKTLIKTKDVNLCDTATIWKNELYCFSASGSNKILLNIISSDGSTNQKILNKSEINSTLDAYLSNNKIYLVWSDRRALFFNPFKLFSILSPSDNDYYGAPIIMAGELNLDTLDFKEYVIKYNSIDFP